MKKFQSFKWLLILVILSSLFLQACASLPAPDGTPDQLQKELDYKAIPAVGTWHIYSAGNLDLSSVYVINKVPNMQIDVQLLEYLIQHYGTPTTQKPMSLIFIPDDYVQKSDSDIGYVGSKQGLGGLTISNESLVTVVIPVGWSRYGVDQYDPAIEECGRSMPGLKQADYVTLAVIHEFFAHGFLRANNVERLESEECTALWFESFVFDKLSFRRIVRFP